MQNCFIAVFADLDGCHAIAMVTGELLENALKYGDWTSAAIARCSGCASRAANGNIEVSVQNPLKANDPNATALMKSIEWINSYPKPEQAYRARMLQIAQERVPRRRRAGSVSCASRSRATAGSGEGRAGRRHGDRRPHAGRSLGR